MSDRCEPESADRFVCAFCGKGGADANHIVLAGAEKPGVCICDACVGICFDICFDESEEHRLANDGLRLRQENEKLEGVVDKLEQDAAALRTALDSTEASLVAVLGELIRVREKLAETQVTLNSIGLVA